jgi:hypothetical protein
VRARTGIALATLATAAIGLLAGGGLVACFDLLHSTSDVLTACELDAAHPGCDVVTKAETDFCAWTPEEARQHALHACTWLGACEAPMGNNAFGPCYFRALMAYDCRANPNHRAEQAAHGLWDCLQAAASCGDVDSCIFRDASLPGCPDPGVYTGCSPTARDVRVLCADGGGEPLPRARGENCALWGQTCTGGSGQGVCAGEASGLSCSRECAGNALHWCVASDDGGPGVDRGIDCTSNGAGKCGGFPSPDAAQWLACRPDSDASTCAPDASATCDDGRAIMCPSGVLESLDCAALLGSTAACSAGELSPPFDWTSPCSLSPSACDSDSCDGGVITSCERGAAFTVNCAAEGLGACRLVGTDPGSAPRAACAPPSP